MAVTKRFNSVSRLEIPINRNMEYNATENKKSQDILILIAAFCCNTFGRMWVVRWRQYQILFEKTIY